MFRQAMSPHFLEIYGNTLGEITGGRVGEYLGVVGGAYRMEIDVLVHLARAKMKNDAYKTAGVQSQGRSEILEELLNDR